MKFIFASVMAALTNAEPYQLDYKCELDNTNCRSDLVCDGPMIDTENSAEKFICVEWGTCLAHLPYSPEKNFIDDDINHRTFT